MSNDNFHTKSIFQPSKLQCCVSFSSKNPTGEKLVQWASENLVVEVLIHCQVNTLLQCMKNLLSSFTRHRHIIHAGYTFQGSGSWILQVHYYSLLTFSFLPTTLAHSFLISLFLFHLRKSWCTEQTFLICSLVLSFFLACRKTREM